MDSFNTAREMKTAEGMEQLVKMATERILESLSEDCPNREQCEESAIENYEPMHDESRE